MNKMSAETKLKIILVLLAVVFLAVAVLTGIHTYRHKMATESFDELDMYSMHEFSQKNSEQALQALKDGDKAKLEKLMVTAEGVDGLMGFAEWSGLDIENAVSMGSGSLSTKADAKGRIDVSERWIVETADNKYVLFIETLASRWGRKNEGISAIGVTTFDHFNDVDYNWAGEAGESSALAGELFWQGNQ